MGRLVDRLRLWTPVAVYMAAIFVFSSMPVPGTTPLPDKLVHAGVYAGLAALLVRALAGGFQQPVGAGVTIAAVVAASAYGASDEIHQSFVATRQADVVDLLADAAGACAAAGALYARSARAAQRAATRRTARRRGV